MRAAQTDAPYRSRCGDYGGIRDDGRPCERAPAWGVEGEDVGRCTHHRSDVEGEVVGHIGAPEHGYTPAPDHLSDRASAIWDQIVANYVVEIEGLPLLETALTQYDRAAQARNEIEASGLSWTNPDSGAVHVNPAAKVERDASKAFRLAWKALDLDFEVGD